ncbi:aspartate aminotransferase family protein [Nocardia cyriacigeorgica]|uniref:aminotransferase class III-fold pyridoxal phosphate-dependent enzyme n=1 Tax=Nocardia TaxID=1817 RepID=UPI0018937013|nr:MULTISPECIES: aminotransferase class III-fold pyridoxal phosphate-dependent enzyme [Nocardia]MBF6102299.1 aspartate aminotransferase family protein [Nocardia cyriacigeorgica]
MRIHRWNGWSSADRSCRTQPVLERGHGREVWDTGGRRYLDGIAAAANTPFGHAHPQLTAVVAEQLSRIAHFDETTADLHRTDELTQALGAVTGMHDIVFVNSGSEAIEAALRITFDYWQARGQHQRDTVITFERGYHGSTALTQALSALPALRGDSTISLRVQHVPLPTRLEASDRSAHEIAVRFAQVIGAAGAERVAAVIVEPFLNVGGGIVLPPDLLSELRTVTTAADTLLIVDEVFTGFGRSGTIFATDTMTECPDILAVSKGMTGGILPMAAACLHHRIRDAYGNVPLRYGHTNSGHGLASAAALTTLELLANGGLDQAATAATWFATTFVPHFTGNSGIVQARSYGVAGVLECDTAERAHAISARALEAGLIVGVKAASVMLTPALNATHAELDEMRQLLNHAVTATYLSSAGSEPC